jgi:hypothetical protein
LTSNAGLNKRAPTMHAAPRCWQFGSTATAPCGSGARRCVAPSLLSRADRVMWRHACSGYWWAMAQRRAASCITWTLGAPRHNQTRLALEATKSRWPDATVTVQ